MIKFKARTESGELINSALAPFNFPAGEAHIKREDRRQLELLEIAVVHATPESLHSDLFQLKMWSDYLWRTAGPLTRTAVVIPYFPGARADRGEPFGAKVYADFVGDLDIDQIVLFDPHSHTIVDLLDEASGATITPVYPHELLDTLTAQFILPNNYTGIIAPDAGAVSRAREVSISFGIPLYTATKSRDFITGKLSFGAMDELPKDGKFLVVDDICDGGGTFNALADAATDYIRREQIDLYVSHGVFSNNALENLENSFGKVFTTSSFNLRSNTVDAELGLAGRHFLNIIPVTPLLLDRIK